MSDYYGAKRIAQRLGVNESTLRLWHRNAGFLMYMRGRRGQKPCWYSNDTLILTWEISRAAYHRDKANRPLSGYKAQITA